MTKKTRRNVLKGLAVTLPGAWTAPIVDSVILPAHAATTGGAGDAGDAGGTDALSAPPNCYVGLVTRDGQFSVMWPGGSGLMDPVPYWRGPDCDGPSDGAGPMAVAASASEAKALLGCNLVLQLALVTGGGIWECCSSCLDSV
jgi:hypothetical protein